MIHAKTIPQKWYSQCHVEIASHHSMLPEEEKRLAISYVYHWYWKLSGMD